MQRIIDQFVDRSLLTNDLPKTESYRWFLDYATGVFTKWLDPEECGALLAARERLEVGRQRGIFPRLLEEPQLVDSAGIYECKWQLVPGRLLKTLLPAETRAPQVSADLAQLCNLQSHIAPALLNLVMSGLPDKHSLSVADLEKIANQEIS